MSKDRPATDADYVEGRLVRSRGPLSDPQIGSYPATGRHKHDDVRIDGGLYKGEVGSDGTARDKR